MVSCFRFVFISHPLRVREPRHQPRLLVQLDGVVEYKSLPSGLHNVQNDLVYASRSKRTAHLPCGLLTRRQLFCSRRLCWHKRLCQPTGRRGGAQRSLCGSGCAGSPDLWQAGSKLAARSSVTRAGRVSSKTHACMHVGVRETNHNLRLTVDNVDDTSPLEEYWEKHRSDGAEGRGQDGSKETNSQEQTASGRRKARSSSDAALLGRAGHTLSNDHPAISMRKHLDTFGPLLFPLYRAALLRKRILILTHTPVKEVCDLGM